MFYSKFKLKLKTNKKILIYAQFSVAFSLILVLMYCSRVSELGRALGKSAAQRRRNRATETPRRKKKKKLFHQLHIDQCPVICPVVSQFHIPGVIYIEYCTADQIKTAHMKLLSRLAESLYCQNDKFTGKKKKNPSCAWVPRHGFYFMMQSYTGPLHSDIDAAPPQKRHAI